MPDARATCYSCFRPRLVCICDVLRPVQNRTRITILQHPRERMHPLNTARIAEGSLTNVRVLRGTLARLGARLQAGEIQPDTLLLYPGPNAMDLEALTNGERPREIAVLDGTWHHASTLLRDLPILGTLRCARFTPPAPSEYQIRKEPRADYLSTIESIAHVLSLLEPETKDIETLRDSFRTMVARNVAARRDERVRRTSKKPRPAYVFPSELALPPAKVVLAYAEGARLQTAQRCKQPLLLCLLHPESGRTLRLVVRPPGPVRTRLLEELALSQAELDRDGLAASDVAAELRAFLGERVLGAWNASTFSMLEELGAAPAGRLLLKAIYCDHRRALGDRPTTWGSMSAILAARGVPWQSSGGRAERRLAQTCALYRYLCNVAEASTSVLGISDGDSRMASGARPLQPLDERQPLRAFGDAE